VFTYTIRAWSPTYFKQACVDSGLVLTGIMLDIDKRKEKTINNEDDRINHTCITLIISHVQNIAMDNTCRQC